MNVLLAIAHYYRATAEATHTSTDPRRREARALAVRSVIEAWRGHLGFSVTLNVGRGAYEATGGMEHGLDIVVLVHGDDHLLDREFCEKHRVRLTKVMTDDPRMVPFGAWNLFADSRSSYDMFVYSEDDLRPADGCLLGKIAGFTETFGWRRIAFPNRYEWNLKGPALKTFVDGDLAPAFLARQAEVLPDEPFLHQAHPGRNVLFRRAGNPHAGFFAVTREQLLHWMAQPHFQARDTSFISPLESAATLGILKTFPIYKTFGRDAGWLEIEHLDDRFSLPLRPPLSPEEAAQATAPKEMSAEKATPAEAPLPEA